MSDRGKVIAGLVVLVVLATAPVWYNLAPGGVSELPELPLPKGKCVEPREQMREKHMLILNQWRDEVVREGKRTYTHPDGKLYEKSLTLTCLGCHTSKTEFCDKCHDFAGVKPYCFDCHVDPEEKK